VTSPLVPSPSPSPLLLLLLLSLPACDRRSPHPSSEPPAPSPRASAITLANVFGTCEPLGPCEADCDAGVADQCRKLGTTYQFGNKAAPKDDPLALAHYERACVLKSGMGCVSAGQMYEFHHGVPEDDAKAAAFYEKGCTFGYEVGCANWAIMLERGSGVAKDLVKARALFDVACAKGAGLACERLKALGGSK
jgi:TPR repeat protein